MIMKQIIFHFPGISNNFSSVRRILCWFSVPFGAVLTEIRPFSIGSGPLSVLHPDLSFLVLLFSIVSTSKEMCILYVNSIHTHWGKS